MLGSVHVIGAVACRPSAGAAEAAREHGTTMPDGVAAVRAALTASVAAWNRGDLEAHVAVYAESASVGPPFTRDGRARARANLAPFFAPARRTLGIDSLSFVSLTGGHGVASGRYTLVGGERGRSGWFTEAWANTPQGWRIVHEHSP